MCEDAGDKSVCSRFEECFCLRSGKKDVQRRFDRQTSLEWLICAYKFLLNDLIKFNY